MVLKMAKVMTNVKLPYLYLEKQANKIMKKKKPTLEEKIALKEIKKIL